MAAAAPARSSAAALYAWGLNNSGQLGNGSLTDSSTPVQVSLPGGVTATAVSEGTWTTLALGSDGHVYAWGYNASGQLGDGTTAESSTPVQVSLPGGVTATAVSEGQETSLALGSDGNIYTWGAADGSFAISLTPVQVPLPGGVTATAVSAGDGTSLALGSDGHVYAWGFNAYGQLGDGTTTESTTPLQVALPGGVTATAVSEGIYTSLALGSDGNLYAWGNNGHGELGIGSTVDSLTPIRVPLPRKVTVTAVSEGDQTSLALGSDGNLYAWGYNASGQLGIGSTTDSLTPTQVQVPVSKGSVIKAVSTGYDTSLAIAGARNPGHGQPHGA